MIYQKYPYHWVMSFCNQVLQHILQLLCYTHLQVLTPEIFRDLGSRTTVYSKKWQNYCNILKVQNSLPISASSSFRQNFQHRIPLTGTDAQTLLKKLWIMLWVFIFLAFPIPDSHTSLVTYYWSEIKQLYLLLSMFSNVLGFSPLQILLSLNNNLHLILCIIQYCTS